ncbi:hypothetical protein ANCCAN_04171, partial [Ancylostoma caninum]
MTPHTFAITCAIFLLPIAYSAKREDLPICPGNKAITRSARKVLYSGISAAKPLQQNQQLDYCCDLEKRAFDYVRLTGPTPAPEDKVLVFQGSGDRFNVKTVVDSWKDRLAKTGTKFGCNLGIHKG